MCITESPHCTAETNTLNQLYMNKINFKKTRKERCPSDGLREGFTDSMTFKLCPWYVQAQSLQSCLPLCNPMDYSPPSSSVHRILQAGILEWVAISFLLEWGAISFSRGSFRHKDRTCISCVSSIAGRFFNVEPAGKLCFDISRNCIVSTQSFSLSQNILPNSCW